MNNFYPISLNLNGKTCIVIGGGKVAIRKIRRLLEGGAIVKVLSPTIEDSLEHLLQEYPTLSWVKASYQGKEDLEGASLVFAATDIPSLNEKILSDANNLSIFANIASHGQLGDFIIPSSFNQGDLQISVSTSGKVPGLSKILKENLEGQFGPEYATLVNMLEQVRNLAISDSIYKSKNLSVLSKIISHYPSILDKLYSGADQDDILRELLGQLYKKGV